MTSAPSYICMQDAPQDNSHGAGLLTRVVSGEAFNTSEAKTPLDSTRGYSKRSRFASGNANANGVSGGNGANASGGNGFWSRVERGEISLGGITTKVGKFNPPIPANAPLFACNQHHNGNQPHNGNGNQHHHHIANVAIITTSMADYSYKATPFGDVYYSPRFQDFKYIYRFVVLTRGVRSEAYRILKHSGRSFLTEYQIIHQLRIDLSPGWEHFMLYRNKLDELILRRRIGT